MTLKVNCYLRNQKLTTLSVALVTVVLTYGTIFKQFYDEIIIIQGNESTVLTESIAEYFGLKQGFLPTLLPPLHYIASVYPLFLSLASQEPMFKLYQKEDRMHQIKYKYRLSIN